MPELGEFLELSVRAPDVRGSLDFYLRLGFTELIANDVRSYPYTVVTDGSMVIGLHADGPEEPALTFVLPELEQHVNAMRAAGQQFEFTHLGGERFNEAALRTPDGHLLLLLEARTFSPGSEIDVPPTLLGRYVELRFGSHALPDTRAFFEAAGFLVMEEDSPDSLLMSAPGLTLAMREAVPGDRPVLRYPAADPATLSQQLAARGIRATAASDGILVQAPEGTRLLVSAA
jgi:hypothetical protein